MHAEINVRFELSIDDDKTIPLAVLAEFVTDQNVESVLLEELVKSFDAARVGALCGENTPTATVTNASSAAAPTPAQPLQPPANTSSTSTTSKIQPLTTTNRAIIATERSVTAKTKTARTPSKQRLARILPRIRGLCWICRSTPPTCSQSPLTKGFRIG